MKSSLRPMRRARISSSPASVSKRQPASVLHDRDRQRPRVLAGRERDLRLARLLERVRFLVALDEIGERVAIGDRVARLDDRLRLRAEDREQRLRLAGLRGGDERLRRLFGRRKVLLRRDGGVCVRRRGEPEERGDEGRGENAAVARGHLPYLPRCDCSSAARAARWANGCVFISGARRRRRRVRRHHRRGFHRRREIRRHRRRESRRPRRRCASRPAIRRASWTLVRSVGSSDRDWNRAAPAARSPARRTHSASGARRRRDCSRCADARSR